MQYWLLVNVITISLPLWVDAINGRNRSADTNLLTISSCVLANTSQLHHYCTDSPHDQKDAVTVEDLNTIEISEKLCGEYKYHQGQACHDIVLLFLKSDTRGLCISSNIAGDSLTIAHANIVNDINHKYFPNCSSVGTLLILRDREFSCILQDFDELDKIEFVIRGYNSSIGDRWTATVTVTIQHHCSSEGRSRTATPYYVEIIALIVLSLVTMVIFCIIFFVSYFKKSKTEAETVGDREQGQQSSTLQSGDSVVTAASESVHVVSNPGALVASEDLKDDYTNNLGKGNLSVQIEKQASTIVSNPEHNVEGSTHYTKLVDTVAGLGVFTAVSITVEPFDQQSADNQDATSEHHCNSEDNLTGTKDSVATIPSVCTTDAEQYITGPCDPQQATSPCGSLTKDSLPGYKRNTMSLDTLKRMSNPSRTTASSSETNQQDILHTILSAPQQNDEVMTTMAKCNTKK